MVPLEKDVVLPRELRSFHGWQEVWTARTLIATPRPRSASVSRQSCQRLIVSRQSSPRPGQLKLPIGVYEQLSRRENLDILLSENRSFDPLRQRVSIYRTPIHETDQDYPRRRTGRDLAGHDPGQTSWIETHVTSTSKVLS